MRDRAKTGKESLTNGPVVSFHRVRMTQAGRSSGRPKTIKALRR